MVTTGPQPRVEGLSPALTVEDLKRDPAYQVVTPDHCLEMAARWHPNGALLLHPMMAGLPPELGWSSLELFERAVLPRLAELDNAT